jgi:hypothetical protein
MQWRHGVYAGAGRWAPERTVGVTGIDPFAPRPRMHGDAAKVVVSAGSLASRHSLYRDHVETGSALAQPLRFLILGRLVEALRCRKIRELE